MPTDPNQRALAVLQNAARPRVGQDDEVGYRRTLYDATMEVANYHAPVGDQADCHQRLAFALSNFMLAIIENCPPGADRSNAIRCAREAKHWASAAVALENS